MNAFDLYTESLHAFVSLNFDIEVTVKTNRFVVLADLKVLWHIWVEVILAGKTAPFGNLAIKRKPNQDGGFNCTFIHEGQRTRHP
ncbi:unannotated protein [freshwater metagenome]|uniref:Unannotated protein n=1 Tax=freshwater metagenome TaxID=449393 RepID=A0A6J7VCP0_9ZZZZ